MEILYSFIDSCTLRHNKPSGFSSIAIILAVVFLSACASPVAVDKSNLMLMPDRVAQNVISRHFGNDWLTNPYVEASGMFCDKERFRIKISAIIKIVYSPSSKKITLETGGQGIEGALYSYHPVPAFVSLFCDRYHMTYKVSALNESDAKEITEALIGLGANVSQYEK